jgi:hypoxanthine phosphoribosyltransferase
VDFGEVVSAARAIAQQIDGNVGSVDGLVGISRGGWIPTRLLSSLLSVEKIYSIGLQYRDKARTKLVCYDDPVPYLESARTLVVLDDCLETGNALRYAKEHLSEKVDKVYTAALFVTDKSVFIPDFFVACLDHPPAFPWELPSHRKLDDIASTFDLK